MIAMEDKLHTELWTSWASLLRSYAAAHGLNASNHAVIEVSASTIVMRVGIHWVRFTPTTMQLDGHAAVIFELREDGTVIIANNAPEEMDMASERVARELLTADHTQTR